jgi:hypothetical protein
MDFLMESGEQKFLSFENLKTMNGKKRKYFSTNPNGMRETMDIKGEFYVETFMNSSGFRNLIIKLLKEYS